MKKEDLLKPRYKVIADYPGGFEKGEILYADKYGELYSLINGYTCSVCKITEDKVDTYKSIVRKLEWWEGREISDLPTHLMFDDSTSSVFGIHPVTWEEIHRGYVTADFGTSPIHNNHWRLPTEEEYTTYLTTLSQTIVQNKN